MTEEAPEPVRVRLPNKRPAVTRELMFKGRPFLITAGFQITSANILILREVFVAGTKTGQDITHIIEDTSVAISLALQYGMPIRVLANAVSRLPSSSLSPGDLDKSDGGEKQREAASVIGAIADLLEEMEREITIDPPMEGDEP